MCDPSLPAQAQYQKKLWADKIQALMEVLLLSGFFSSFVASLPFSFRSQKGSFLLNDIRLVTGFLILEASITLILLMIVFRLHGESWTSLGFRKEAWLQDSLLAVGLIPVLFLINIVISEAFRIFLPSYYTERNPLVDLIRTPRDLMLFVFSGVYAGGIKEELQRAFIIRRFDHHLGGAKLGLILWSIVFGAGHYLQGMQGTIAAGIFGLLFGMLYLLRKSLIPPILAHGLYDTVALMSYWFFISGGKHH